VSASRDRLGQYEFVRSAQTVRSADQSLVERGDRCQGCRCKGFPRGAMSAEGNAMRRKITAVLTARVMASGASVVVGTSAQASAHIVWVGNGSSSRHVVGTKATRVGTVYSAGTSGSCVYGRAHVAYSSGTSLKYVTGQYAVPVSVAEVGPAFGVSAYHAAGGGFANPGPWKAC